MMKRYIVLVLWALTASVALAQFDPTIGQYMFMPTAYNPAAAGEGDLMKVQGLHRMQFTGIEGAPMTTYFSFASPFVIGKTRHGVGVRFLNDMYGLFSNQTLHVQYAYRQKLGNGYLSAGVDLGFVSVTFSGDSVNLDDFADDEYHTETDPAVPTSECSGMSFDMGVGLYYTAPRWYAGISYSHVSQPYVEWNSQTSQTTTGIHLAGTLYAVGGYNWQLRHYRDFVMKPSVLMMTDFRGWDVNLTWLTEYKERYRWGLSYRVASGVSVLLGMDIISGLSLGYSYELPTSKLLLESYGNHEIYLAYGFNVLRPKRTNRYKSVRYL